MQSSDDDNTTPEPVQCVPAIFQLLTIAFANRWRKMAELNLTHNEYAFDAHNPTCPVWL